MSNDKDKFVLARTSGMSVQELDLIKDMKRVAKQLGKESLTQKEYSAHGQFNVSTIIRRLEGWNNGTAAAGLVPANRQNISKSELFENLLNLWQHCGRQPRRSDLAHAPSTISQVPYNRTFGSWTAALKEFVNYANSNEDVSVLLEKEQSSQDSRGGRDPSLRLRYKVLVSDNFKCRICGNSPATSPDVRLHIDHIIPWSKGGATDFENLRTLCSRCNLGKGNLSTENS